MKDLYKAYLFSKHILVNDEGTDENGFYALFALARKFGIEITEGKELAHPSVIRLAAKMLGENVPEPFYRGFPDTVKGLTRKELLLDQLFAYYRTYDMNNFDEAVHSVMEEKFRRLAFNEKVEMRRFIIVNEKRAEEILLTSISDVLSSSRPLNKQQYSLVREALGDFDVDVTKIGSVHTLISLYCDTGDERLVPLFKLSDVIKLTDYINYFKYGNKRLNKLNLKNADRKFITATIRKIFQNGRVDLRTCYEKKATWCGLLHHIHYVPKSASEEEFLTAMRSRGNKSAYSDFERFMEKGNIKRAIACLKSAKGSGAVLRNLDYIVSRCRTEEDVSEALRAIGSNNGILFIQLLQHYYFYSKARRTFKFTSHYMVKAHLETIKEAKRRKSVVDKSARDLLSAAVTQRLCEIYGGTLGKVYVDEGMKKMALPLQETASSGGFGVLPKGSRLPIDLSKILRVFTYWSEVDDIDLSCIGIYPDGRRLEFSWRNMFTHSADFIVFSGDQTSGYDGGSEYFDIDFEGFKRKFPTIKQLVFCNNVYSREPFSRLKCKAGYMVRSAISSGEVFEPSTVKSSFDITCDSTFAYMFAIDLVSNELVWLNLAKDSSQIIAAETEVNWLLPYLFSTKVINVYDFYSLLATELVSSPEEADVVVSDKELALPSTTEQIHSYDFERTLALMNK